MSLDVVGDGRTLGALLAAGEIDAIFHGAEPPALPAGAAGVRRLFPRWVDTEREYYARTGIFPIMHVVALRREVYERDPWLAPSLLAAFERAKAVGWQRLVQANTPAVMLPWLSRDLAEIEQVFGADHWPYGVGPNYPTLDATCQFHFEQGLSSHRLQPEEAVRADHARRCGGVSRQRSAAARWRRSLRRRRQSTAPVAQASAARKAPAAQASAAKPIGWVVVTSGTIAGTRSSPKRSVRRVRTRQRASPQRTRRITNAFSTTSPGEPAQVTGSNSRRHSPRLEPRRRIERLLGGAEAPVRLPGGKQRQRPIAQVGDAPGDEPFVRAGARAQRHGLHGHARSALVRHVHGGAPSRSRRQPRPCCRPELALPIPSASRHWSGPQELEVFRLALAAPAAARPQSPTAPPIAVL